MLTTFFMEAEHADLLRCLSEDSAVKCLLPGVKFLLDEQYVQFGGECYKGIKGSGVGSQISSDICVFWLVFDSSRD